MRKKIIINADDFGITRAVSDAIINVYQNRSLTSTSLMVNMPAAEYAAALAKERPELGVGLHFNITEGCPLSSEMDIINQEKRLFHRYTLMKRILFLNLR